jgi:hypothetical protein
MFNTATFALQEGFCSTLYEALNFIMCKVKKRLECVAKQLSFSKTGDWEEGTMQANVLEKGF